MTGNWGDYTQNLGFVTQHGAGVLELLNPQAGEKILDVGCGDGTHVKQMIDKGIDAYGVDAAPEQIKSAETKGLKGRVECVRLEWARLSAIMQQDHYGAVYSNAALHYITDTRRGFAHIAAVLKKGGRLVAEMGGSWAQDLSVPSGSNLQSLQQAISATAKEMNFQEFRTNRGAPALREEHLYLPTTEVLYDDLARASLRLQMVQVFNRPTPVAAEQLPAMIKGYASNYLGTVDKGHKPAFISRATELAQGLMPRMPDGTFIADYVRLRFVATKGTR